MGACPMAEFPIMPFYIDAYMGDTRHLSTLEHGAYLLLLFAMWRAGGGIENDDDMLAKCAGLTSTQWRRVKPKLMKKMHVESGYVTQAKLLETLEAVRRKSILASDSARARWLKTKGRPHAFAQRRQSEGNAIQIVSNSSFLEGGASSESAGQAEQKQRAQQEPPNVAAAPPKVNGFNPNNIDLSPSSALLGTRLMKGAA